MHFDISRAINICTDTNMLAMCQQSRSQIYTRFSPVNTLARDEVHDWVWFLLNVPHLARLSRLCRGWPRPCWRRLPATGAVFVFWSTYTKFLFVRIGTYQSGSTYTRNRVGQQVGLCHLVLRVGGSNPGWRFYVCAFFTVFFFCWRHLFCYLYNMYDDD